MGHDLGKAVRLRRATLDDGPFLRELRNDPVARAAFLSSEAVTVEAHLTWLSARLRDPAVLLFIAEAGTGPVGQVRLDFDAAAGGAEVSVTVAPSMRGRGIGRRMVELACVEATAHGATRVVAHVRPENVASRRTFAAAGFREDGLAVVKGVETVRMTAHTGGASAR
jgi:L-amino acid N-acyltransferase YncA